MPRKLAQRINRYLCRSILVQRLRYWEAPELTQNLISMAQGGIITTNSIYAELISDRGMSIIEGHLK